MIPFWKPGFFTVGLHLHWVKFLDFFFFFIDVITIMHVVMKILQKL